MEDEAKALEQLLKERVEQTTRDQLVSWATDTIGHEFSQRMRGVLRATSTYVEDRTAEDGIRTLARRLGTADRRRVEKAVDSLVRDLAAQTTSVLGAVPDDAVDSTDDHLPRELQIIFAALLAGPDALAASTRGLSEAVSTVEEWELAEALLGERIGTVRSAVWDGLLVTVLAALEDLVLPLLRLALMTTAQYAERDLDDHEYQNELVRDARMSLLGGPNTWRKRLGKAIRFDVAVLVGDWDGLVEASLRRNVVVHHGGRADDKYLKSLPSSVRRPSPTESLPVTSQYVEDVAFTALGLGVAMATLWPALLAPEPGRRRLHKPNSVVLQLLAAERWMTAERVSDAFLLYEANQATADVLRVNRWMARRERLTSVDAIRAEVESWCPVSDEPSWALARAALLGDLDEVRSLLAAARARGERVSRYSAWPLLRLAATRDTRIRALIYNRNRQRTVGRAPR